MHKKKNDIFAIFLLKSSNQWSNFCTFAIIVVFLFFLGGGKKIFWGENALCRTPDSLPLLEITYLHNVLYYKSLYAMQIPYMASLHTW